MATLPTLEQAERAILDVFKRFGTRPGESIKSLSLTDLMTGNPPQFKSGDLDAALRSMHEKEWIDASGQGWIKLLEKGYAEV